MSDNGIPENERVKEETSDIARELAELGKKFGEAINAAWNSEERYKIQGEIKDGLHRFSTEVDSAIKNLRESDVGEKVKTGVRQVREDVEAGKVADELRRGTVTALRGLSEALDKMASSFTPADDEPKE
jgi:predicted DNA-binding protein (UPF0278 family)